MEDKELAFLRVTDPEKYKDYLAKQELKKRLAFPKLESNIDINGTFIARMYESFGGSNLLLNQMDHTIKAKCVGKNFIEDTKMNVEDTNLVSGVTIICVMMVDGLMDQDGHVKNQRNNVNQLTRL